MTRIIAQGSPLPDALRDLLRGSRKPVILTGAGISAESGVPTFREVQTGLWERFSAQELATLDAFEANPALVWTWYRWRQSLIRSVEPNPGHFAVARWQDALGARADVGEGVEQGVAGGTGGGSEVGEGTESWLAVVTQNVDDLHERAGAQVLAHLHGTIAEHRCHKCAKPAVLPDPDYDGFATPPAPEEPPSCDACADGMLRPNVVWFGELLPMEQFDASAEAIHAADLIVVVGTSALVQPAASLPLLGLERGTPLIEVNPEESDLSEVMNYCLRGPSGTMLPQLVEAALTR